MIILDDLLLLIHFDSLTCHSVDDAVVAGVHVDESVDNGVEENHEDNEHPQDNVKDHWVVRVVLCVQVQRVELRGLLLYKIKYNS